MANEPTIDEAMAAADGLLHNTITYWQERALAAEADAKRFRELMARVHGDGGHYLGQHGPEKAFADADLMVAQWRASLPDVKAAEPDKRLAHALQHTKVTIQSIVDGAKARPDLMCGYWDTACTHAEIAAKDLEGLIGATPIKPEPRQTPSVANEPKPHGKWIIEYPGDVFVIFDPTTDGAGILGAERTLAEAEALLNKVKP